jgi:selenocysteine lyase/cysteine desulfurase
MSDIETDRRIPRRQFVTAATATGGLAWLTGWGGGEPKRGPRTLTDGLRDWRAVRAEFALSARPAHFDTFLLASHPRTVRDAIERHRRGLDADPHGYLESNQRQLDQRVLEAAAACSGGRPDQIALTDSTTMGLGLVYGAIRLAAGQEVLTTEHDFYATHQSLRLRTLRDGTRVRRVRLYRDPDAASIDGVLTAVRRAIRAETRVLAVTWVHSSSGVKLPLSRIADVLAKVNRRRRESGRVLLCVDGVHGFANQPDDLPTLGSDVFVSGCHKWLFGPRGTGIIWASDAGSAALRPVISTFDGRSYAAWLDGRAPSNLSPAAAMTPGGFHSFEHRWALAEAFAFQRTIGKQRVAARTSELAAHLKDELSRLPHVRLRTPRSPELSAGLVCFEHGSRPARTVVRPTRAERPQLTGRDRARRRRDPRSLTTGPRARRPLAGC